MSCLGQGQPFCFVIDIRLGSIWACICHHFRSITQKLLKIFQ